MTAKTRVTARPRVNQKPSPADMAYRPDAWNGGLLMLFLPAPVEENHYYRSSEEPRGTLLYMAKDGLAKWTICSAWLDLWKMEMETRAQVGVGIHMHTPLERDGALVVLTLDFRLEWWKVGTRAGAEAGTLDLREKVMGNSVVGVGVKKEAKDMMVLRPIGRVDGGGFFKQTWLNGWLVG